MKPKPGSGPVAVELARPLPDDGRALKEKTMSDRDLETAVKDFSPAEQAEIERMITELRYERAAAEYEVKTRRELDPREKGFNYGAALGAPDTIRFRQIVAIADKLRQRDSDKARERSWRLDMAIRAVRLACDENEQARKLATLEAVLESF